MVGESTYVPPPYVPLRQSDAEADLVSLTDVIPAAQHIKNGPEQWSSGICACFDDMQSCCIGLVCPCYLFGKNAEVLGSGTLMGSCMMHFILWALVNTFCCMLPEGFMLGIPGCFVACYACGYRKILRSKYNLEIDRRTRKNSSSGSRDPDPLNELGQAIDLNEVSCLFELEIVTLLHCGSQEAPCGDFITHFFCHLCAICQEYREIRERSQESSSSNRNSAEVIAPTVQTMESASAK